MKTCVRNNNLEYHFWWLQFSYCETIGKEILCEMWGSHDSPRDYMGLKMKALQTSKTSEIIYQLSWCNTAEDLDLQGNTDLLYSTFVVA
jgi:hypothetical protein